MKIFRVIGECLGLIPPRIIEPKAKEEESLADYVRKRRPIIDHQMNQQISKPPITFTH